MDLSVIIVNYNVRHFLEQALASVRRAMRGISGDVWVVDNNSVDDSVRMVREKFPEVHLIANKTNTGFATANNQAIRASAGRYVLLLNPDTLVEEDTLHKCLDFMERHPDAGALGVRLIDGSGKYLPESKRGFPTPWVAFCKTFGLSTIFPKSALFNRYYLGHLSENETHPVDVLVGAFMFMRREALDKSGLLDEAFFMYGEDIDLSYRITLAGYQNYYFPETQIIHYKGESTKKGSLNYVRTFYQAMIIFAQKHFHGKDAGLFVLMLQGAIWFRAALTLLKSTWDKLWLPALDAAALYGGLVFLKNFWANYYYKDPDWFKPNVLWFNFPLYILFWLGSVWLSGGYDQRYNLLRLVRGLALGTLILAAVYGFLDLDYRPSRALLLMGAAWAVVATVGLRLLFHFAQFKHLRFGRERTKNIVLVASMEESERVAQLLRQAGVSMNLIGTVVPPEAPPTSDSLGDLHQLDELVRLYNVDELIFCSKDVPARDITAWMARLGPNVSYKMVPEESGSIIGSSNKNEPGELYTVALRYSIAEPGQRRNKRVFDLLACLAFPIFLSMPTRRRPYAGGWWAVLSGQKTWVGYAPNPDNTALPRLKSGVFDPTLSLRGFAANEQTLARLNYLYAKDWSVWKDLFIMVNG